MNGDYLQNELQRLDLLLHREILRLRAQYQLSLDEFRGLYVSDQQVDALLRNQADSPEAVNPAELTDRAIELYQVSRTLLPTEDRWSSLRSRFQLTEPEMDILVLALALESHPKYETLFAYLNNDVTRKWPTCDLALRLFAEDAEAKLKLRELLLPSSRLFGSGLLHPVPSAAEHTVSLSGGFHLAPEACHYLLHFSSALGKVNDHLTRLEPRTGWKQISLPPAQRLQLERLPNLLGPTNCCKERPLIVFVHHDGMGASQIVQSICAGLRKRLLMVSAERARATEEPMRNVLQSILLEQRLEDAALYLYECDALFGAEGAPTPEAHAIVAALEDSHDPVFLSFDPHTRWRELLQGYRKLVFVLEDPDFPERRRLWKELGGAAVSEELAEDLANRFVFGPGRIRDAIVMARDRCALQGRDETPTAEDLLEGARAQSDQSLGKLASPVRGAHGWSDLVLPPSTLRQLQEIKSAMQFRHRVYSEWGFDQRLVSGKGLKVLFSGPAGTGKTMTAGIIARDLGLDLYKIDLSGIVSKFIGETEKNLDRIFRASRSGNAILFFDEADALFGKRSEVKDAHDRYANIEVAYLLQKMEEHDGVVILATNLSRNMDDAFARRMHYVVEFPLPNALHRDRLWRGMFPPQAPLSDDVDFKFLSEQFPLPGGDIRNIVLSAAFLAAQDGSAIHMRHLVPALGRMMVKKGKLPSATEFKQYHTWLVAGD
ncbi:MAG TPA: AAA family ATPase [Edaphobacter sp.]|nr:AAA family ATPase [Edaphobacter sp.]